VSDNTDINIASAKGVTGLFQSARWKAYLQNLQDEDSVDDGGGQNRGIYHAYHSQILWFTREEGNGHRESAEEHLKRSDALLEDCATKLDALEEILANTPKPSEVLDWNRLW
jgi:hypothetical protein